MLKKRPFYKKREIWLESGGKEGGKRQSVRPRISGGRIMAVGPAAAAPSENLLARE